jgi:hypothetical protein
MIPEFSQKTSAAVDLHCGTSTLETFNLLDSTTEFLKSLGVHDPFLIVQLCEVLFQAVGKYRDIQVKVKKKKKKKNFYDDSKNRVFKIITIVNIHRERDRTRQLLQDL